MRYDLLAQQALLGVVRAALEKVAKDGLPGEHHFFISFATSAPGVQVSSALRQRFPEEMTVVLQHTFWDLEVNQRRFSVKLSFDNAPETLVVPFAAVKGFFDPSVQFGLQFEIAAEPGAAKKGTGRQVNPKAANADEEGLSPGQTEDAADGEVEAEIGVADQAIGGAEVVSLDQFRKK